MFEKFNTSCFPSVWLKLPIHESTESTAERVAAGAEGTSWRVEFRPMDVQATDGENAAYAVFVVLVARMALHRGLDGLARVLSIRAVHEDMARANLRDAVRSQRFLFPVAATSMASWGERRSIDSTAGEGKLEAQDTSKVEPGPPKMALMTIDEIIYGPPDSSATKTPTDDDFPSNFPGLVPLVRDYVNEELTGSTVDKRQIHHYLDHISSRAAGSNQPWRRRCARS